jgi:hypothetical protein
LGIDGKTSEVYQTVFLGFFLTIYEHNIVTRNFLRYTFRDVISSRFKASYPYAIDAAVPPDQGGIS